LNITPFFVLFCDTLIPNSGYKKELPHLPDMQGQADIVTEDISLLERLVAPVRKVLREKEIAII